MRWTATAILLVFTAPLHAQARPAGRPTVARTAPADGVALLARMHDRYATTWYRTLSFTQTTSQPGRPDAIWYEAGSIPGKLRIDIAPIDSGNAMLYVGDSAYTFARGQLVRSRKDRNLLMTLGFDVYAQPAATTAAQLRAEGMTLGRVRAGTWQGRAIWVVGAAAPGDTTASQFWVDKERLVFVRLIQNVPNPRDSTARPTRLDVEFNKYRPLAGGWIAEAVVIRVNGSVVQTENYADIRANTELDPAIWDTRAYCRPAWVK
ncbi:MAG: hypothetical protein H0U85_01515 [Gemmatimonadales bacterium]|nr:hypothetical protein [Gemmatimonadales bacterium]